MISNFLQKPFEEILTGDTFRSRGRTVTEADIVSWCALTGDWHVVHSDAHYAARSRFGQRIAPGLLVYAIGAGLGVPAEAKTILANYGADRLRFTAPTFIGDTVHLEAEVKEKKIKREGKDGVVTLAWNIVNQNDVAVVLSDLSVLVAFGQARASPGD